MSTPSEQVIAKLERVLFVYDPKSGEVLGVEFVSTVPGAKLPPLPELEQSVKADASSRLSRPGKDLRVASMTAKHYRPGAAYRFDRAKNRLVRVERADAQGKGRKPPSNVTPA